MTATPHRIPSILAVCLLGSVIVLTAAGKQGTRSSSQLLLLTPEQQEILSHMSIVYLDDGTGGACKTIRISDVNVQIVNGLGATETANCVGNLILGYNETGNPNGDLRTGSHNLVGGSRSSYSSYGGLVVSDQNTISAPYATVTGGKFGVASGDHSSISGGRSNTASGAQASVSAGLSNTASGEGASVTGGKDNVAGLDGLGNLGQHTTVCGGVNNQAIDFYCTVGGGQNNIAGHLDPGLGAIGATVSGSCNQTAQSSCLHLP